MHRLSFLTSMKYIHEYVENNENAKILDVGAGTGRYSVKLANEGYDVTAIELVKHNLGILKSKGSTVKAMQGTALDLSRFSENTFDMTLVFGPMYHLYTFEDKVKALQEAKRVTKVGGVILVAYCMNEYTSCARRGIPCPQSGATIPRMVTRSRITVAPFPGFFPPRM